MIKLTPEQIENSKAWIHDVLVWGKMTAPQRPIKVSDYSYMYGNPYSGSGRRAAQTICNFIVYRKVDYKVFQEVDEALNILSNERFMPKFDETSYWGRTVTKAPSMLAKYLANFMRKNQFFLDTTNTSTYELDEIKKTMIGSALWENLCFTSQDEVQPKAKKTTSAGGQTSNPTGAPQNGYKAAGPQSGGVPNLVGQPNQKIMLSGLVFCVEADKVGKNTPNAFVTPVSPMAGVGPIPRDQAEKVKFGSGNGYTDCKCWFTDIKVATDFSSKCSAKFGPANKFVNFHVSKANADRNGYFEVTTEFGINAYIKASRLNEEVLSQNYITNKEESGQIINNKDNNKIDINEFEKEAQKEIDSLKTELGESYESYF